MGSTVPVTQITTGDQLREFLKSKDIPCAGEIALLEAGSGYVFRITTPLGQRRIIKHTENYLRATPEVKIQGGRLRAEAAALQRLRGILPKDEVVRIPEIHHWFKKKNVIEMQDGGMETLAKVYRSDRDVDMAAVGHRLGTWLARLHKTTGGAEKCSNCRSIFSSDLQLDMAMITYRLLPSFLLEFGYDPAVGNRIIQRFGMKRIKKDSECFIHADFCPGNIVVSDPEPNVQGETGLPSLTVIDWELARIGNSAIDVGHFMAHAWLLDLYGAGKNGAEGDKGLTSGFVSAYFTERRLGERFRKRAAVHFAVQLIYHAPACDWMSESSTEEAAKFAYTVLRLIDLPKSTLQETLLWELFAAKSAK